MYSQWTLFLSMAAMIRQPMHLRSTGQTGPIPQSTSVKLALCYLVGVVVVAGRSSLRHSLVGWVRPAVCGRLLWPIGVVKQLGLQGHAQKTRNALLSLSAGSYEGTTRRGYVRQSVVSVICVACKEWASRVFH